MTGFLHEKEFSRAAFVKGGGALVVGFSVGSAFVGKAQAAGVPVLPSSLVISGSNNPAPWAPDPNAVDSWIAIHADNTVSLMTCKCEVGGGQMTSLSAILAEELGMNMGQVKFVTATTKGMGLAWNGVGQAWRSRDGSDRVERRRLGRWPLGELWRVDR